MLQLADTRSDALVVCVRTELTIFSCESEAVGVILDLSPLDAEESHDSSSSLCRGIVEIRDIRSPGLAVRSFLINRSGASSVTSLPLSNLISKHLDLIVSISEEELVRERMNVVLLGGSSSIFRSACWAGDESLSASSIQTNRGRGLVVKRFWMSEEIDSSEMVFSSDICIGRYCPFGKLLLM